MKYFTILIAFLISANVIGQQSNNWSVYSGTDIIPPVEIPNSDREFFTFEGSPYYEKDFVNAIAMNDKGESEQVLVRYNIVADALHLKKDKSSKEVLEMPIVRDVAFELDGYRYIPTAIDDNIPGATNYYAEFYKNKNVHLIGIPGLKLNEGNIKGHQNNYYENGTFEVGMDYYISIDNGNYELLELKGSNKKKFGKALAVVDFLKESKNVSMTEFDSFLQ